MKHLFFSLLCFVGLSAMAQETISENIGKLFKTELKKENIKFLEVQKDLAQMRVLQLIDFIDFTGLIGIKN